jgi:hypothetical protein
VGISGHDRSLPSSPARPGAVRLCAFLQFGAAIPLGVFTASIASRLEFLGVRAAGVPIDLFGGIATAVTMIAASSALWVMSQPGIVEDRAVLQALYWLVQGLGGVGFSVPFGILAAGITIPAAVMKLIPKWVAILGIAIAICGEVSWLYLRDVAARPTDQVPRIRVAHRDRPGTPRCHSANLAACGRSD